MGKRLFLFLLLIYMRFLTTFYAKNMGLSPLLRITTVSESVVGHVLNYSQTDGSMSDFLSLPLNAHELLLLFTFLLNVCCHGNHL